MNSHALEPHEHLSAIKHLENLVYVSRANVSYFVSQLNVSFVSYKFLKTPKNVRFYFNDSIHSLKLKTHLFIFLEF